MTLIVLVIAFAIELLSDRVDHWRSDRWFEDYFRGLSVRFSDRSFWHGPAGIALVLAFPILVVAFLQGLLHGAWLGLLGLLFALAVLIYSLRYQPLERTIDRCCDALEAGDRERARSAADQWLAAEAIEDPIELSGVVMVQSQHRLFAVVFWFALLGPVGALLYRLTWLLAQPRSDIETADSDPFRASARQLLAILDWVPVRLVGISYALAGSFDEALHEWRSSPSATNDLFDANYELLHNVALGALGPERYDNAPQPLTGVPGRVDVTVVRAARAIVMRSAMLWGIVVALFTLGGMAY